MTDQTTPVSPAIQRAGGSIHQLFVCYKAPTCGWEIDTLGSGWVVSHERVVTNAHVVKGARSVHVRTDAGDGFDAKVVVYDPVRDLAILSVPGLTSPPLPLGGELKPGDPVTTAGYPGGLWYQHAPARVAGRGMVQSSGVDGVTPARDTYILDGSGAPGLSGGPVLDADGAVVGVVYSGSVDGLHPSALTLAQSRPVLDAATWSLTPVSTGKH